MSQTEAMRAHNLEVIRKAMRKKQDSFIDKECLAILQELGKFVLQWIRNKTYTYEDQTYNLTDSTGCAIYKDGTLTKFEYYPKKQAAGPNVITYKRQKIAINGRDLLTEAISGTPLEKMGSYTLVVISAAPYGVWVNESLGDGGSNKRGKGWFDDLEKAVRTEFERIKIAHNTK